MPSLVHAKERLYFTLSVIASLLIYAALAALALTSAESVMVIGFYLVFGFAFLFLAKAMFLGYVRGNGVRVSREQLPAIQLAAERMCAAMGLATVPDIFVLQSGGLLNAFATKFLGRNFVILYSEVVELALTQGEAELDFIVCHELAHLHRRHLTWRMLLFPSVIVPFLGPAYSRGCEYTCDRYGAHFVPQGATNAMLVLAGGKHLYRHLNAQAFVNQVNTETGLWVWYAEKLSSHPNLPKRVAAISEYLFQHQPERAVAATAAS